MKTWMKPAAIGQEFAANDYVSACTITVKCDYWPDGVDKRLHYDLMVPASIEGGTPGVDVGMYYTPCNTSYTYDVNVTALKPVVFTQDGGGEDIGSHSAYYWIELEEDGGKDFHVSSVTADQIAEANLS